MTVDAKSRTRVRKTLDQVAATVEDDASTVAIAEGAFSVAGVSGSGTSPSWGSASAREGEKGEVGSMVERTLDTRIGVRRAKRNICDGATLLAAACWSYGDGENEDLSISIEHPLERFTNSFSRDCSTRPA